MENSVEQTDYELFDFNPFDQLNYYRLKQIDYDGTAKYSNVTVLRNNNSSINIFPSIIKENESFNVIGYHKGGTLEIYGINGVKKRSFDLALGERSFSPNLDKGIYIVKYEEFGSQFVQRLIVQ